MDRHDPGLRWISGRNNLLPANSFVDFRDSRAKAGSVCKFWTQRPASLIWRPCRATVLRHCEESEQGSTASASINNGASASNGLLMLLDQATSRLSITTHKEDYMSRLSIHPGEILSDELAELGVTPTELSRQIAVPPNRVTQLIKGQRGVTGDTALRLGHWFGTSPQFWLNLQSAYDIRRADELSGKEIRKLPTRDSLPGETSRG
jgi:addiction module HigA family antidote